MALYPNPPSGGCAPSLSQGGFACCDSNDPTGSCTELSAFCHIVNNALKP